MLNSRQFTVISVVTASVLYAWSRFHNRKKQALLNETNSEKCTQSGNATVELIGTAENIKAETPEESQEIPLNLDTQECAVEFLTPVPLGEVISEEPIIIVDTLPIKEVITPVETSPIQEIITSVEATSLEIQPAIEDVVAPIEAIAIESQPSLEELITPNKTASFELQPAFEAVITPIQTEYFESQPSIEEVISITETNTVRPQLVIEEFIALSVVESSAQVQTVVQEAIASIPFKLNMIKTTVNSEKGSNIPEGVATSPRNDCDMSGSEISEEVVTPSSSQLDSDEKGYNFPKGIFNDPDNDIVEDSLEVVGGKTIPRVLVPSDLWEEVVEKATWRETFYVPASMGGVLIGRFGKNVRDLKSQWNAEFSLNMCPGRQDTLLLRLSCPLEHKENVIQWITGRFKMRPSQTTIGNPNQLRRLLPLGEYTNVKVRSLYGLKEFFVTVKDVEYERYVAMQKEMDKDYLTLNSTRMQLYEPVTSGTVAVLPHLFGFARALILKVLLTWPRQAVCFLLDHGTFGVVSLSDLRKIKAKYMRVPFQAIHVSWAHALPIYSDVPDLHILRTFFASNNIVAYPARMETCCRASVALLDYVPPQKDQQQSPYTDILALACRSGLYVVSPLGVFPNRQMWVNRSTKPYYSCPNSEIDYSLLVEFYNDDESYSGQHDQEIQPLGTSQSQNMMHSHKWQNSQRGRGGFNRNSTRRYRGGSQGGNGNASSAQKKPQETQKTTQNENVSRPARRNTGSSAKRTINPPQPIKNSASHQS